MTHTHSKVDIRAQSLFYPLNNSYNYMPRWFRCNFANCITFPEHPLDLWNVFLFLFKHLQNLHLFSSISSIPLAAQLSLIATKIVMFLVRVTDSKVEKNRLYYSWIYRAGTFQTSQPIWWTNYKLVYYVKHLCSHFI